MKHIITAMATIVIFGTALFFNEQHRRSTMHAPSDFSETSSSVVFPGATVRAAGRIEGLTEVIELRARMTEQIDRIHVRNGDFVRAGDLLVSLDAELLESERDLSAALVAQAEAKKERLQNGYLPSEVETARQQYHAAMAQLDGAQKAYDRAITLRNEKAISQQAVDDLYAEVNALRARSAAARASFETLDAPPRQDELLAAEAAIQAAKSKLRLAQINLDRASIRAPIDSKVLAVEAEVGELTGPDSVQPLVILSDTAKLRVVAEIDEYDALSVQIGQACEITSDAVSGVLATGSVSEIEPLMNPKRMYGQWAGERIDSFSRRVWIDLDECGNLPIGLPVDVYVQTSDTP